MRTLRNCDGQSNPRFRTVMRGQVLTRCPAACMSELSRMLVRRWRRHRFLGFAPGRLDKQAELVAQAFEIIEDEAAEAEGD